MSGTLLWAGSGVYVPAIVEDIVEWRRNDTDPFVGVQVNSTEHARTFAAVMLPIWPADGELQDIIDIANADIMAEEWQEYWLDQAWMGNGC